MNKGLAVPVDSSANDIRLPCHEPPKATPSENLLREASMARPHAPARKTRREKSRRHGPRRGLILRRSGEGQSIREPALAG
jgi:hypothetical protein